MLYKACLYFIIVLVSGCASPSLKQTQIPQSAIEREEQIQKQLAEEQLYKLRKRLQSVETRLAPEVRQLCSYLSDGQMGGCYFPLEVEDSPKFNAYTDGKKVVFYSGIIKLLDKDEELAVVLGHEYAHAMLLHVNKSKTNMMLGLLVDVLLTGATGVSTEGTFSEIGAKAYSKDFETEADYAGLYLAHRAGYDISQAANVWRKMAIENGAAIVKRYNSTHPGSPRRYLAQENTYAEIIQKEMDGLALLPDKLEFIEEEIAHDGSLAEHSSEDYKPITRDSKKKPDQATRKIGKYSIAAEDHAELLGCRGNDAVNVMGNMTNTEFGIETYEFDCVSGMMQLQCEFGNCTQI